MKQQLQRIEQALNHTAPPPSAVPQAPTLPAIAPSAATPGPDAAAPPTRDAATTSLEVWLQATFPTDPAHPVQRPALPYVNAPGFTSHRQAANPSLALNLLQEMQQMVTHWQRELAQVQHQIQDLYLEGPIVDGWLESYTADEGTAPAFRHADVNCLMDYVEKQWGPAAAAIAPEPGTNSTGYRLCGLNEDGQLWFRHCPPEQVAAVGLAIARYQRLQNLTQRRQQLEDRLSHLAETLIELHQHCQQS